VVDSLPSCHVCCNDANCSSNLRVKFFEQQYDYKIETKSPKAIAMDLLTSSLVLWKHDVIGIPRAAYDTRGSLVAVYEQESGRLVFYDQETGIWTYRMDVEEIGSVDCLVFHDDFLVFGGHRGNAYRFGCCSPKDCMMELINGELVCCSESGVGIVRNEEGYQKYALDEEPGTINVFLQRHDDFCISQYGTYLAYTEGTNYTVIHDLESSERILCLPRGCIAGGCMVFLKDDRLCVWSKYVIWIANDSHVIFTSPNWIRSVVYDPQSECLLVFGQVNDASIFGTVRSVRISDSNVMWTSDISAVCGTNATLIQSIGCFCVDQIASGPDGREFPNNTGGLFSIKTGALVYTFSSNFDYRFISTSVSNQMIVTDYNSVYLLEVTDSWSVGNHHAHKQKDRVAIRAFFWFATRMSLCNDLASMVMVFWNR